MASQKKSLSLPGLRGLATAACLLLALPATVAGRRGGRKPIMLDSSGGFQIGGERAHNPEDDTQTLSCDHGYMEYFLPWHPRQTSIVMWHSSSTQVWQNRWDGGEGFKDMFLRRDYPVYLWDGPRVGRANWGCEAYTYTPEYRDLNNFSGWRFGPEYPEFYPGVQFPTDNETAWWQATSARYQEFDNWDNVQLQARAAARAADSGKIGDSIVYLTNSAGGYRAQMTVAMSEGTNIKGIVTYESIGYVFPPEAGYVADTAGGFGPMVVSTEDFAKLANLTSIQFVWGDNWDLDNVFIQMSRDCAQWINDYGGNAEVIITSEDWGLEGNTHIPFADMNNDKIGDELSNFLAAANLDGYA